MMTNKLTYIVRVTLHFVRINVFCNNDYITYAHNY